jgi:hypothetical protein
MSGALRVRWAASAAVLVVGVAAVLSAVQAEGTDSAPPETEAAPKPKETLPDPFTMAGQKALAPGFGRHHTPSPIILPDQSIELRFSHRVHLKEGATCNDCHASTAESVRSSDVNLPAEATCLDCHFVEDGASASPPAACTTCHPGYEPQFLAERKPTETRKVTVVPMTWDFPHPNLKMNHKIHLSKGITCDACHKSMDKVDLATRENALPVMGTCLGCHDGRTAPNECRTCHLTLGDGRVQTKLANQRLMPAGWYFGDSHHEGWLMNHKAAVQSGDGACYNCHAPKECVDCHNGVSKPLKIHPNNWVLAHPVSARRNSLDCTSCHREQTFCLNCHQSLQVGGDPTPAANRPQNIRFHPAGWADTTRNPNHHSFQAQRNIRACASCHTEATCVACHATQGAGGLGRNPHPPGFAGSNACKSMLARNARVCTHCHLEATPAMDCRR